MLLMSTFFRRHSGYERMEHGTSRSFVVTHPDDIGQVKRVEFYWEYDMDVLQPRSICFFWCNDHLYVSSIGVTEAEDDGNRGYDDHKINIHDDINL